MVKKILVIGATGTQGGAVVAALLRNTDLAIRALVRDERSEKARLLKDKGIELYQGNIDSSEDVLRAMQGVYGVYSMQNWQSWSASSNAKELEELAGMRIADMALKAGVKHLVYSSAGGADRAPGIEAWERKYHVEQHIRKIGIGYTILRPVAFMDNFLWPNLAHSLGLYKTVLNGKPIQLIAVQDIGDWVAQAFSKPQDYMGVTLEIAGDQLTYDQIQGAFRKVLGHAIQDTPISNTVINSMGHAAAPLKWLHDVGYNADIPKLRSLLPTMLSFEDWMVKHRGHFKN